MFRLQSKTRSILMLIGPLVHLFKQFKLPLSGGCKLGARTVRPHLFALEKLGVKINTMHDEYEISVDKLRPSEVVLYETGDHGNRECTFGCSQDSRQNHHQVCLVQLYGSGCVFLLRKAWGSRGRVWVRQL